MKVAKPLRDMDLFKRPKNDANIRFHERWFNFEANTETG